MKQIGTQQLETNRLILRRFQEDDAVSMFSNWCNDDEVTRNLAWSTHKDIDVSNRVLASWLESYANNSVYHWGIEIKETSELIGSISIVKVDEANEACEIAYCIGRSYWRKGIMTESLERVIEHIFEYVQPERLYAYHLANNPASGSVMKKAGLKYEGRLRHYRKNSDGNYEDCDMYSILKNDFK